MAERMLRKLLGYYRVEKSGCYSKTVRVGLQGRGKVQKLIVKHLESD